MKRIIVLVFGICLLSGTVKAQADGPAYGTDSIKTLDNASIYIEYVNQGNYKDALPCWRYVFNNAPRYLLSTYTNGVKIMEGMYMATKNPAYIDTLMMVYDQWIKYFGDHNRLGEGYALGKKGASLFSIKNNEDAAVKEAFGYLTRSYEMEGSKTHPVTVTYTFVAADRLLKNGDITPDEYMKWYLEFAEFADKGKTNAKNPKPYEDLKATLDQLFFNAGVADCAAMGDFLTKKFEKEPTNIEVLKDIARLLRKSDCMDLPLFSKVAEATYQQEPTAEAASNLALMFLRRKEFDKAEVYLNEALSKGVEDADKADIYLRLAHIRLEQRKLQEVKKNALEALKYNPNSGNAYIMIATAYAYFAPTYGEDAFDKASVYLAVVDKLNRAKQIDPSVAGTADNLIRTFSQQFPSQEEAFFRSINVGDQIKIGSWVNETTKARFRK